jgi:hypothetical protein
MIGVLARERELEAADEADMGAVVELSIATGGLSNGKYSWTAYLKSCEHIEIVHAYVWLPLLALEVNGSLDLDLDLGSRSLYLA